MCMFLVGIFLWWGTITSGGLFSGIIGNDLRWNAKVDPEESRFWTVQKRDLTEYDWFWNLDSIGFEMFQVNEWQWLEIGWNNRWHRLEKQCEPWEPSKVGGANDARTLSQICFGQTNQHTKQPKQGFPCLQQPEWTKFQGS
jgi:hypothetical protein